LVACGGAKGDVQIVDAKTKSPLRSYLGHTAPVHAVRFAPDLVHLFSAGDDKSVRFWDIPTASPISTLENAHDDYIRCCAVAGGVLCKRLIAKLSHVWPSGSVIV
jgi:U3 small nucleolar RNA-associated protein 15